MLKSLLFALLLANPSPGLTGASKVNDVLARIKEPKQGNREQKFVLSQHDLNEWAKIAIQSKERLGVKEVQVELMETALIRGRAVINMDEVKLEGFAFRMFRAVLSGTQTLVADGRLIVGNGKGRYEVVSARFNDVWVPAWLVTAVVSTLTKRQHPNVDITEDFELPHGIRDIRVIPGKVEVVR